MEKKYFSSLSKLEKIDFVWNYGEIINELESSHYYNSLFVLNSFFVEVRLNKISNEIVSICVQEDPDELFKYVKTINLGLFQHG